MPLREALIAFVKESLQRGLSRSEIEATLLGAGWPYDQVQQALSSFADMDFPIPVPRPVPYVSARETFFYVVMFGTLFVSAYHFGALLFALIDLAFPHSADRAPQEGAMRAIRWSASWLLVAFPVFLSVAWRIRRTLRTKPTARASKIRRQLTYLTLFVASCVLIGAVTAVVYNFLSGGMTVRFVLKVLVVATIAGAAFGYYLRELRDAEKEPET